MSRVKTKINSGFYTYTPNKDTKRDRRNVRIMEVRITRTYTRDFVKETFTKPNKLFE